MEEKKYLYNNFVARIYRSTNIKLDSPSITHTTSSYCVYIIHSILSLSEMLPIQLIKFFQKYEVIIL